VGDFCTTSSMYGRSDRSLLGFHLLVGFPRGFAIQGAMWEIFAEILWSMRNLILTFLCFFSLWVSGVFLFRVPCGRSFHKFFGV